MNDSDLTYIFNEMINNLNHIKLGISSKILENTRK